MKLVCGFDYRTRKPVEATSREVSRLVAEAKTRSLFERVGGDAVIFESTGSPRTRVIAVEYYDRD